MADFSYIAYKGMAGGQSTPTSKIHTMNKIYADQIDKAKNLAQGIDRNAGLLQKNGVRANGNGLLSLADRLKEASDKQDAAMEALNASRDEAHELLADLKKMYDENKAPIKSEFPQEDWIHFGIADKR